MGSGRAGDIQHRAPSFLFFVLSLALVIRGLGSAMNLPRLECFQLEKSGSLLGEGGSLYLYMFLYFSNHFGFYLPSTSLI